MQIPSRSDPWTTLFGHTSGLARISKFCLDRPSGIPKKFDHFVRTTSGKCHFLVQNLFGWTTGLPTYIRGSLLTSIHDTNKRPRCDAMSDFSKIQMNSFVRGYIRPHEAAARKQTSRRIMWATGFLCNGWWGVLLLQLYRRFVRTSFFGIVELPQSYPEVQLHQWTADAESQITGTLAAASGTGRKKGQKIIITVIINQCHQFLIAHSCRAVTVTYTKLSIPQLALSIVVN